MKKIPAKTGYRKRLEYSFILILTGVLFIFYLFPRGNIIQPKIMSVKLPAIQVIEIPRTIQKKLIRKPRPSKPAIPVAAEEIDLLEELTLDMDRFDQDEPLLAEEVAASGIPDRQPRQLVEVVPEEIDEEIHGVIVLSLKISKNGKILQHKVLKNSTRSNSCLKKVLQAAYRSRWEPAVFGGKAVDFWIEKTYIIN